MWKAMLRAVGEKLENGTNLQSRKEALMVMLQYNEEVYNTTVKNRKECHEFMTK